jgi:hypothetical protein
LTITPDVYEYQNQSFQKYLQENFAFVASEGVYTFYLNQTIFDQDPIFCKNKAFRTLMELENSGIAPNSCSRAVTNMAEWYSVSKNSRVLGDVILNQYPQTFYLESREANNRSLTFEISMITKHFSQMETIVSFDDIVNVKYGNSDDVYLELISTADGYRWISGADISKYFWQNLTLTFVYDIDAFRAEIYFNGVLVSSTLRGVNGCSFSPIRLPTSHSIRTCVCSNITELYSIKLWNRALSCDEIRTTGSSDSGSIDRTRDSLKYVLFRI